MNFMGFTRSRGRTGVTRGRIAEIISSLSKIYLIAYIGAVLIVLVPTVIISSMYLLNGSFDIFTTTILITALVASASTLILLSNLYIAKLVVTVFRDMASSIRAAQTSLASRVQHPTLQYQTHHQSIAPAQAPTPVPIATTEAAPHKSAQSTPSPSAQGATMQQVPQLPEERNPVESKGVVRVAPSPEKATVAEEKTQPSLPQQKVEEKTTGIRRKRCPYCGRELPLGEVNIYCPYCGKFLI